jgi:hypothetical protein
MLLTASFQNCSGHSLCRVVSGSTKTVFLVCMLMDLAGDRCTHDAEPQSLASINLAPWDPSAYNDYSWVQQRDNSSVLLEVSMTCLFNNIVSECFNLKNVVEVFVLLRSYEATKQHESVFCNSFLCSDTSDKTLLALSKVHKHIRGAPVADRFTPGASARVLFQLQETLSVQISIHQAHASSAYAQ